MLDTTALRAAYRALLEAAATVAEAPHRLTPPPGEWNADQILAHVSLLTATTISAASAVAAGQHTTYDNRLALDTWTIDNVVALTGDNAALRERLRQQGEVLCALGGAALTDPELDTLVPTRLLSADTLLLDQPLALRDLISGLADAELPGHTDQLLALLAGRSATAAA
ncbi:hypothetical protein GFY24_33215 [Nocardia sp. SYP-A9097]|uniref:hypothetical protein n=1 Tax=Nocardia sp. SYP-A9097 TaxID=2663237 RepID=UPI00129AE59D|nr:hypothetical protein [Nocardia sp. SYP-A9097]MRH92240.1 hypothetical protein [Nocardia sp. SYP-A9097]